MAGELDANSELIGLGAANAAAGLFGGYPVPVTGGFSRTAVNDTAEHARRWRRSCPHFGVV